MLFKKKKKPAQRPEPHFVRDYERLVDALVKQYPIDEAMSRAVGGSYDRIGLIEKRLLERAGLQPGMSLVDIGCGSGRLAVTLPDSIDYLGTDVVQKLLDYAASKSPASFKFQRHVELSIPRDDSSTDMVCAFSVFTHLQHTESFIYMTDVARALRPGGVLVFSFLEFAEPAHWEVFMNTTMNVRAGSVVHLDMFIERNAIAVWAEKLGFAIGEFIDAGVALPDSEALGQSTAILRKL